MSSIFDKSKFIYRPKKRHKSKTKKKSSRLERYADKLNQDLPASEVWFQAKWKVDIEQHKFDMYKDKYNYPFGKYIPDVINLGYKYIIEIDGSIHDDAVIKWKDSVKDKYYKRRKFQVFRIKAYDETSYLSVLEQVREHIVLNSRRQY